MAPNFDFSLDSTNSKNIGRANILEIQLAEDSLGYSLHEAGLGTK